MKLTFKGLDQTMWRAVRQSLCKLVPQDETNTTGRTSSVNILCFVAFGTMTFFNQEMLLTASEDILSGHKVPTSAILVTFVGPLMAVKILCPWCIQRIPYWLKILVIALFMMAGILLIVYGRDFRLQMVGIGMNAMATGAGELTLLSLSSFYPQICISAFVAGTGLASLVSPLYYAGVTTWTCVAPRTAILITAPWAILFLIIYAILDKDPIHNGPKEHQALLNYDKIKDSDPEDSDEGEIEHFSHDAVAKRSLDCNGKMVVAWKLFPFIIPLFVSFFAEYLAMSSVVTTVSFPSSGISPRDHFQYYSLSYRLGKFVGRSYLFFFALCFDMSSFTHCRHTWVFAAINLVHLLLFLFESWYHFLPGIWLVIILCSTVGLVSGLIVLHSPHAVASVLSAEEKEFGFGLLTVGNAVGAFTAGLVGLATEPFLMKQCHIHFPKQKEFCMTRQPSSTGWTSNTHC